VVTDQTNILVLAPQYFRIWEAPEIWEMPTIPDDKEGEIKILQVYDLSHAVRHHVTDFIRPLIDPSRGLKRDLIVFRRPTNEIRLVSSASPLIASNGDIAKSHDDGLWSHDDQEDAADRRIEKIINIHSVQMIPRYAFMNMSRISNRFSNILPRVMELRFPGTTGSYRYEFKSDDGKRQSP
jgi:hypothetical protein